MRANAQGGVQLRLDSIDALETHYTPRSSPRPWRQNATFGDGAGNQLLRLLGFDQVTRGEGGIVTASDPEAQPGAILTRFADQYGRAVAMAFSDTQAPEGADGSDVFLDIDGLRGSVNFQLLDQGCVYPTFYSKLFFDLREEMAETTRTVRKAGSGVWAEDSTIDGFTLESRDQLTTELTILPKLFRRLAEYLALDNTGGVDLGGFSAFLEAKADRLFTVPDGQFTHLDTLVERYGQNLRLKMPPEQLVFIEN